MTKTVYLFEASSLLLIAKRPVVLLQPKVLLALPFIEVDASLWCVGMINHLKVYQITYAQRSSLQTL